MKLGGVIIMEKGVFILGELNVDLIFSADEITLEWNRERLVDQFDLVLGSSSAITACSLAGLGETVYFVGVVGDDEFGRFCIRHLEEKGVDTRFVKIEPTIKTGVTLSLSTQKDRALLTYMGAIPDLTPDVFPEEVYTHAKHLHFGSFYLQQKMQPHWKTVFSQAQQHGITTSFDTGWAPDNNWHTSEILEILPYTNLFIPSEDEFLNIFSCQTIEQAIAKLPKTRGAVAVKRGSKGAAIIGPDGMIIHKRPFNVVPIDTTGAGDSFNAGLIASYLKRLDFENSLDFANACGALATQRIGGAGHVPSFEDVRTFIKAQESIAKSS
jgi:sugar/nucleoside kinase (ribokinase family)